MQGSTGDEGLALSTDSALEMPFSEAIFNYFSPAGFLDWKYTRTEGKKNSSKYVGIGSESTCTMPPLHPFSL